MLHKFQGVLIRKEGITDEENCFCWSKKETDSWKIFHRERSWVAKKTKQVPCIEVWKRRFIEGMMKEEKLNLFVIPIIFYARFKSYLYVVLVFIWRNKSKMRTNIHDLLCPSRVLVFMMDGLNLFVPIWLMRRHLCQLGQFGSNSEQMSKFVAADAASSPPMCFHPPHLFSVLS